MVRAELGAKVRLVGDGDLVEPIAQALGRQGVMVEREVTWASCAAELGTCTLVIALGGGALDPGQGVAMTRGAGVADSDIPVLLIGARRLQGRGDHVARTAACLGARRLGSLVVTVVQELVALPAEERASGFKGRVSAALHQLERVEALSGVLVGTWDAGGMRGLAERAGDHDWGAQRGRSAWSEIPERPLGRPERPPPAFSQPPQPPQQRCRTALRFDVSLGGVADVDKEPFEEPRGKQEQERATVKLDADRKSDRVWVSRESGEQPQEGATVRWDSGMNPDPFAAALERERAGSALSEGHGTIVGIGPETVPPPAPAESVPADIEAMFADLSVELDSHDAAAAETEAEHPAA